MTEARPDASPELPGDGDGDGDGKGDGGTGQRGRARPVHLRGSLVGLVFLGGSAGTLARWVVGLLVPHAARLALGTLVVNVVGAFVLGALLEHLARRGPDVGRRRALRVTLGTGFCGGFTTYSALASDTAGLLRSGLVGHALAYVVSTLVLGLGATALGILVARRRPRGRDAA